MSRRPCHDCPQPWDDLPTVLPDDAPFDAHAFALGAQSFDGGAKLTDFGPDDIMFVPIDAEDTPEKMVSFRVSFCFGYLAAQKVAAERGRKPGWSG